jgi:hypothetical protein
MSENKVSIENENKIQQFEKLCQEALSEDSNLRVNAEKKLSIINNINGISQLQEILSVSNNHYALFLTSKYLLILYTENWSNLNKNQKNDMSFLIINY